LGKPRTYTFDVIDYFGFNLVLAHLGGCVSKCWCYGQYTYGCVGRRRRIYSEFMTIGHYP
jgi:hypothetical protein